MGMQTDNNGSKPGLLRVLGLKDVIGIVVGSVIGSGIFIVPAAIAMEVKSPWLIFAVWLVGGILSFFGALSFSELGGMFPQAGGMYVYLRETYGPLISFLFGWTLFLVIDTGSVATLASAFATKYLPHFVRLSPLATRAVILAVIAFLVAVNYVGVRWGALLQNLLTLIKVFAVVAVSALVFLFAKGNPANFSNPAPGPLSGGLLASFGIALVASLWAYKGWEAATFSTGEVKNPERNLYLGLLIGMLLVLFLYMAANLAYLYVFPAGKLAMSNRIAAHTITRVMGPAGASFISFLILFSIMGAANANVLTSPRVYYAMAQDGLFFKKTATVHQRFHTPHVSIIIMGIWSVILAMSGTFEQLATFVVFGQWIFFGLTVAAVMIMRRKRPELMRPYKTWGYPLTPLIFILGAILISASSLISQFRNAVAGLLVIFLGVPVFRYWQKKRKRDLFNVVLSGIVALALILVLIPGAQGKRITILYDWMNEVKTGARVSFPCDGLDASQDAKIVNIGGREAKVTDWNPKGFTVEVPSLDPGQYEVQVMENGKVISAPERAGLKLTVSR